MAPGNQKQQPNEERLRALVRAISTFAWVADAAGEFTTPQAGWEAYTGHDFERHRGDGWLKDVHPDDRARVAEAWAHAVRNGSPYEIEWRCWHKSSQSWRQCSTRGEPILNVDGSVREWIGAVLDTEDRMRADEVFQREWLRLAQSAGYVAFWEWRPLTGEARWTGAAYQLFGAWPGSSDAEWDKYVHAEDRERVAEARRQAAVSGNIDLTFRIARPDGETRWIRCRGRASIRETTKKLVGILVDVTDIMGLEERYRDQARKLEDANRELALANEQLSQFNLAASHDLREPLRNLSSFVELLQTRLCGKLDGETTEFFQMVLDSAHRMRGLLDDLMAYALVSGPPKTSEVTESREAFEQARENVAGSLAEAGASLEVGPLPAVVVEASSLVLVFQNLLSNAVKYHGASAPVIRVSAIRDGDSCRFVVEDDGIGIAPEYHDSVFEMFKRLHARSAYEGTGVGLALCKRVVERHGGRIWVDEPANPGATFAFTIPLLDAPPQP